MMLKTALFYPRYVKFGSVIYLALIGHSFPSKWDIFCRKPLSKTCKNKRKQQAKFPFVLLPSKNDSWMCSCILSSWENGIPLNKLFTLGGRLFNRPKRKHVLKRAESHRCEVNTFGIFACNFARFLRFLEGIHFRKSLTESERSDRCWPGKFLKIIEHVSNSIRYCRISLHIYSGSSRLSNTGRFL